MARRWRPLPAPRGGRGNRQSPLNPQGGGAGVGGVFDRFINALDRITQNLVGGLPGQSTNSQAASERLNTRINLASAAFVAQRAGSALGETGAQAGQVLGAAAFGFNAAGPVGAAVAGGIEILGITRRNAEQHAALMGQKALNQNQVGGNPVERAQQRIQNEFELRENERRGTWRGFLDELGSVSPTIEAVATLTGGGTSAKVDRIRASLEAQAAAQRDPALLAEGFTRANLAPFIEQGIPVTPQLLRRAQEKAQRQTQSALGLEVMLGYTGNERGTTP